MKPSKFLIKTNKFLLKTDTSNSSWMSLAASEAPTGAPSSPSSTRRPRPRNRPIAPSHTWCLRESNGEKTTGESVSVVVLLLVYRENNRNTRTPQVAFRVLKRTFFEFLFLAVCPLSHHVEASFEEHWFVQIFLFSWFPSLVSISPPVYPVPNPRPWGGRSEGEKSTEMPGIRSPPKF